MLNMGKQVNFYMTDPDEEEFVRFIRSDRSVGIFMYVMRTKDIPLLAELPEPWIPFGRAICLWDRDNSPAPVLQYVPEQRYYAIESSASEIIEFSRSHLDGGRLVRGRIWAELATRHADGTLLTKSESFQKWFDRLASWIRRHSVRDKRGDYVLPGAAEYAKRGGSLVQAVFAESVHYLHHVVNENGSDRAGE